MKRREFLAGLGAICALGLSLGASGCAGMIAGGSNTPASGTPAAASPTVTPATGTGDTVSLAGTCPRGKNCQRPGCQLWTDQNGNGVCDRGRS